MWHYSTETDRLGVAARRPDNASAGMVPNGSKDSSDIAGQGPTRHTRVPDGLIKRVLWGCVVFVVASVFSLQCVLADMGPPPFQPLPFQLKPPRYINAQQRNIARQRYLDSLKNQSGFFSGFSAKEAALGMGCLLVTVELFAFAGLVVSRRRRKDEMAAGASKASPVDAGGLEERRQDDNR